MGGGKGKRVWFQARRRESFARNFRCDAAPKRLAPEETLRHHDWARAPSKRHQEATSDEAVGVHSAEGRPRGSAERVHELDVLQGSDQRGLLQHRVREVRRLISGSGGNESHVRVRAGSEWVKRFPTNHPIHDGTEDSTTRNHPHTWPRDPLYPRW